MHPIGATHFMAQEERLEMGRGAQRLLIGIPRETSYSEKRVPMVPAAVSLLSIHGHEVVIENGAGKAAGFSDNEYSEAGARVVYSRDEVYKAGIILKVAPPTPVEIGLLRPRQVLISSLNWSILDKEYFHKLNARKVTAFAFEYLRDTSGSAPLVRAMSEIAGNTAIYIACHYLSDLQDGRGIMFGGFSGITPTQVVILGAGTVGEFAARAALGMGAQVKVFDNSIYKLRRLQNNLNVRLFTSIIEPLTLGEAIRQADVVIGAMYNAEGRLPCMVSEEMIRQMREGSVVIDVSIDHGGCFETSVVTSHERPVVRKHGIIHYGVPNIPSMVPKTASYALSNFFGPLMLQVGESGGVEALLRSDYNLRQGVYLFNGSATNRWISEHYDLPFSDIGLLMAALR
ncbi:MAG TPA: alanine dehydrogenase [Bacteroidales bacterium]|nr:alanine dehydrogenase [Bacteroidales bacterium]